MAFIPPYMIQHLFRAPILAPQHLPKFTSATRPDASDVEAGTVIWNTDDNAPNYADENGNWRDALGNLT